MISVVVAMVGGWATPSSATPNVGILNESHAQFNTSSTTGNYTHVVSSGSNLALIVTVTVTLNQTLSSVVWDPDTTVSSNEQSLTCPAAQNFGIGSGSRRIAVCSLLNPTTSSGNGQVKITLGTAGTFTTSATTFSGISAVGAAVTSGSGKTFSSWANCSAVTGGYKCSVAVTTAVDDVVFDLAAQGVPTGTTRTFTATSGQTQRYTQESTTSGDRSSGATSVKIATGTSTTMEWTYTMPVSSGSVGQIAVPMTPASSISAITLRGAGQAARVAGQGTQISWQTEEEIGHLGFQVWRESADGGRVRVTKALLPGSVFATGDFPLAGARSYSIWDKASVPSGTRYWLEEIALTGGSVWHGPIQVQSLPTLPTLSLSALPNGGAAAARLPGESLATGDPGATLPSISIINRPSPPLPWRDESALSRVQSILQGPALGACDNAAANLASVKIGVARRGLYRITADTLFQAGLPSLVEPARLVLTTAGREVPLRILLTDSGALDAIEFFSDAVDTRDSDTRVLWLSEGASIGRSLRTLPLSQPRSLGPTSYFSSTEVRERSVYFAPLLNGPDSNFLGPIVSKAPVVQRLPVTGRIVDAARTPTLEVRLQGASLGSHQIAVSLNGTPLGDVNWQGRTLGTQSFSLDPTALLDGDNEVTFANSLGTESTALVERLAVGFTRAYRAVDDELEASAPAGASVSLRGFTSANLRVFDLTDAEPTELAVGIAPEGETFAVTLVVPGERGERLLYAVGSAQIRAAAYVEPNRPSALCAGPDGELAVIAPRSFFDALGPYVAARRAAGWSVDLIDLEDVYDEMTFGQPSALAITRLIKVRREREAAKTRYLLLVGDASFDPRNFLGKNRGDVVPTGLFDSAAFETASDDMLADLDGDGVPEVAVGRWPVREIPEVEALVARTLAFDGRTPFERGSLVVAGADANFSYADSARQTARVLPGAVRIVDAAGTGVAKDELLAAWAEGPSFVQYFGHGSVGVWTGLLSAADVPLLAASAAAGRTAVVSSMTCLNAFFHDVYQESLAELLLAAPGGPVAVWGSSSLDSAGLQRELGAAFAENLKSLSLGEAVRATKASVPGGESLVLLGDPTLFGRPSSAVVSEPASRAAPPSASGCGACLFAGHQRAALPAVGALILLAGCMAARRRRRTAENAHLRRP